MYEYQTPAGYGDIFYVYVFDANENGLAESSSYNMLGVQITDGEFIVRNWTGAYTLLNQTPSTLGKIQFYMQNLYRWFQQPAAVFTLNPSLQNTSVPLIEEKLYPINGNIRFDLLSTSLRFNNVAGVSYGTQTNPAAPSAQLAFFGVRRSKGYVSDPQPPDDGRPFFTKPHQIPFTFALSQVYPGSGSILQTLQTYQVPVRDYDFELRHITKFSGSVPEAFIEGEDTGTLILAYIGPATGPTISYDFLFTGVPNMPYVYSSTPTSITVQLATDSLGDEITTVNQVVASINSDPHMMGILLAINGAPTNPIQTVNPVDPPQSIGPAAANTDPRPSPFAITLYDGNKLARMSFPVLAEFLIDDTVTPNGRNFWPSPPIKYRCNSVIQFDACSLLSNDSSPINITLLFNGVWRIPCQ